MESATKKDVPYHLKALIGTVLEVNGIDLNGIKTVWAQQLSLQKVPGAAGVVFLESGEYYIVVNVPVLVMPVGGRIFSYAELMRFTTQISEIPTAQYAIRENVFYLTFCLPAQEVKEAQVFESVNQAISLAEGAQLELLDAILSALPPVAEHSGTPEVSLPNIKMTPADAEVIYGLLASVSPHARKIYKLLMEQWEKAGYFVETTPSSVVLEIPYGPRRTRLAALLWGGYGREPVVGLVWNALRKQTGFPPESLDAYQAAVKKLATVRTTPGSAYILARPNFTQKSARQLIGLMSSLARSVHADQVETPTVQPGSSMENIALTLESCPLNLRVVFRNLLEGWQSAGGLVQCRKVGRISLKMKTGSRSSVGVGFELKFKPEPLGGMEPGLEPEPLGGLSADDPLRAAAKPPPVSSIPSHTFSLATLVAPGSRRGPAIDLAWKLASGTTAYLAHIPLQVSIYEKLVSALPGFTQSGAFTTIRQGEPLSEAHTRRLLNAMTDLLKAQGMQDS